MQKSLREGGSVPGAPPTPRGQEFSLRPPNLSYQLGLPLPLPSLWSFPGLQPWDPVFVLGVGRDVKRPHPAEKNHLSPGPLVRGAGRKKVWAPGLSGPSGPILRATPGLSICNSDNPWHRWCGREGARAGVSFLPWLGVGWVLEAAPAGSWNLGGASVYPLDQSATRLEELMDSCAPQPH